jgi:hypothetical protein
MGARAITREELESRNNARKTKEERRRPKDGARLARGPTMAR